MKNKKVVISVVLTLSVLIALFVVASTLYKNKEAQDLSFKAQNQFKTFVPDYAMKKGSPDAKVFVVEFFDPECESCREMHPHIYSIMSDYEGKIQLVMRYAAFHGNSILAIQILEAARLQGKYWEALEILFQHQPEWGNHHHPRPELIWEFLPRLGIDTEEIKKHLADPKTQEIIAQDTKDGQELHVTGTPTFFVDGKKVEGYGPDPLRAAIDEALKASEL